MYKFIKEIYEKNKDCKTLEQIKTLRKIRTNPLGKIPNLLYDNKFCFLEEFCCNEDEDYENEIETAISYRLNNIKIAKTWTKEESEIAANMFHWRDWNPSKAKNEKDLVTFLEQQMLLEKINFDDYCDCGERRTTIISTIKMLEKFYPSLDELFENKIYKFYQKKYYNDKEFLKGVFENPSKYLMKNETELEFRYRLLMEFPHLIDYVPIDDDYIYFFEYAFKKGFIIKTTITTELKKKAPLVCERIKRLPFCPISKK